MLRREFRIVLILGTAIALAQSAQALAQDATVAQQATPTANQSDNGGDQAGGTNSGDIIVTARRTEERLQDVPISISVFSQQQLANNNVVNPQDLATYTPSLSANANFGNENTTFAIRGFVQEIGTAPSVGVYFADVVTPRGASNGIPAGDGLAPGVLFDLQNVQVLKGPQGTLFGRNTTGGAVLVVPQKPTDNLEGYVQGSIGNYDMRRLQAVINIPLADTFRVRAGLDRMDRDGYLKNISGIGPKRFSDVNYWSGRLSIVGDLTPDLENYTVASYTHSNTNGPLTKLVAADPAQGLGAFFAPQLARQGSDFYNVEQALPRSFSRLDQWQIVNTTTWKASDTLTIKNIASYAELKQTINAPEFGTNAIIDFAAISPLLAGLGSYNVPFTTITPPANVPSAHESTFTEELQIQGRSMDDRLTWQAGGYLELAKPLGLSGSQSSFLAACSNIQTFQCTDPIGFLTSLGAGGLPIRVGSVNYTVGKTSFRDVGVYSQATYRFTDHFRVTAGARYTWDRQTNVSDQRVYLINYPPFPGLVPAPLDPIFNGGQTTNPRCTKPDAIATGCVSTYKQSTKAPTWTIDLEYTPTPELLGYLKYSRGYRAGTIAPNVAPPFNFVKPEKVDTYELGVKGSFGGALRGTFSAAGFYNDFRNQQIQLGFNARPGSGQASTAAPVNVNKAEIWGFEADASIRPFAGLRLSASYAYLRTKIKEVPDFSTFNDPNFLLSAPFQVGDPEPLSPRNKLTVSGDYTLPLDDSIGRVSFGATFSHRGRMLVNYGDRANSNASIAQFSYLPNLDLLNLNANWESIAGSPVDLAVFVTNVTKEKYYNFVSGLGAPGGAGFETAVVGEPRMYGISLKVHFGT